MGCMERIYPARWCHLPKVVMMASVVVLLSMAVVVRWMYVVVRLRMRREKVVVVMLMMSVAVKFGDWDRFELTAPKDPGRWGSN